MARDRFDPCLAFTLKWEGGYSDHPQDPGGATNRGVTQRVYDGWRDRRGQPRRPVREIEGAEVQAIYRAEYWDRVRGDELPAGVDLVVFDYAVNSGVSRAAKAAQALARVAQDGAIGPKTVAAIEALDPWQFVIELCEARLAFLKGLSTWPTFGKGWNNRVQDARATALGHVSEANPPTPAPAPAASDTARIARRLRELADELEALE